MAVLEQLEPQRVFRFFEEICQIPHGSGDTKRISDYLMKFAEERGLKAVQDEVNNVIIWKPGTAGYETKEPVILQGHMDMVCEKTLDSDHDFEKDPLDLYIEDGFVRARGTTLGGDDGIALAFAMAVLDSNDMEHPPIEALFTVDEETSMIGAEHLDMSLLKGKRLINIDSEEEGVLTVGCAGGFRQHVEIPAARSAVTGTDLMIQIKGLKGGHSGSEIDRQRGNANKLMARLLNRVRKQYAFDLVSIDGGFKENVITYSCIAHIVAAPERIEDITGEIKKLEDIWKEEFGKDEPDLTVELTRKDGVSVNAIEASDADKVISFLLCAPQGVQCFNRELAGQVETSLNLGVLETTDTAVRMQFLVRSSMETKKEALAEELAVLAELAGGEHRIDSAYPAWGYNPDSRLRPLMFATYKEVFGEEPKVETIHAGLECGLFAGKRPEMDSVSFGPDIFDVHSVNERLDIASTGRMWEYLKKVLKNC